MGCGNPEKKTAHIAISTTKSRDTIIDGALRQRLSDFAAAPRARGQFGFYVYDLTADKPVYGVNEHQALPSASCMKLLSGVAGIHLLGPKHLYYSTIYTRGQISGDTLHGDIAFKADLDPQLQGADLTMFAQALKRKGIRKFDGRLYVDLLLQEPVRSEPHWYPWDLSFSRYGVLYKGAPRVAKELKAALRNQGISVADSQVVMGRVPRGSQGVFRYYRSIDRVTRRMWKNSSNTQATSLLYTIGHHVDPKAEPTKAGVAYLRAFMRDSLGLKDTSLVIHDACGLCTHNHLSPAALTTVLRYGYHHKPIYHMLYNELSIAGVDGTLRIEMAGQKTRGRIRAKTGTLSHPYGISSLAGYCKGTNGHMLAFAIMDSEMSVLDARVLQRKLCEALVE
ncbi:MAG: D-alanyl-D-alanine carboxypeptidase [Prevotella sp.]|nr:D-alanyl-D-alanine carboxypeptidase [Prevotella sp.]